MIQCYWYVGFSAPLKIFRWQSHAKMLQNPCSTGILGSEHPWREMEDGLATQAARAKLRVRSCRKSARRCGGKHIFQVKTLKTRQLRTTFGLDVEKVHAVVARSAFPSQNVQKPTVSDHFLEVEMSKSRPLWREARFQEMYKNQRSQKNRQKVSRMDLRNASWKFGIFFPDPGHPKTSKPKQSDGFSGGRRRQGRDPISSQGRVPRQGRVEGEFSFCEAEKRVSPLGGDPGPFCAKIFHFARV